MNHFASEAVVVTFTAATAATGAVLTDDINERMVLIPFIGSLLVSGAGFLLNPEKEAARVVFGRALIALFVGVICTQSATAIWPSLEVLISKPLALMAFGGLASGAGYILARPVFAYIYKSAPGLAVKGVDLALEKAGLARKDKKD